MREENASLVRELLLSRQTEEELARRNYIYQKTIKTLLTRLREQGEHKQVWRRYDVGGGRVLILQRSDRSDNCTAQTAATLPGC